MVRNSVVQLDLHSSLRPPSLARFVATGTGEHCDCSLYWSGPTCSVSYLSTITPQAWMALVGVVVGATLGARRIRAG